MAQGRRPRDILRLVSGVSLLVLLSARVAEAQAVGLLIGPGQSGESFTNDMGRITGTSSGIEITGGVTNVTVTNGNFIAIGSTSLVNAYIQNSGGGVAIQIDNAGGSNPSNITINNAAYIIGGPTLPSTTMPAIVVVQGAGATAPPDVTGLTIVNVSPGVIAGAFQTFYTPAGNAIDNSANTGSMTIINGGTIDGNVLFGTGSDTLILTSLGLVNGNVVGQNAGSIVFTLAANANASSDTSAEIHGSVTNVPYISVGNGFQGQILSLSGFKQLTLGAGASLVVYGGEVVVGSGSTIVTTISGPGPTSGSGSNSIGQLLVLQIALGSGSTVTPVIAPGVTVTTGARYILAHEFYTFPPATVGTVTVTPSGFVTWEVLPGNAPSLGQSAEDVYLVATGVGIPGISGPGAPAVPALDALLNSSSTAASALTAAIKNLTGAPLASAVNSLSGQTNAQAPVSAVTVAGAPMATIASHLAGGLAGGGTVITGANPSGVVQVADAGRPASDVRAAQLSGFPSGEARGRDWTMWAQGYGIWGSTRADSNGPSSDLSMGGGIVGLDARVADNVVAGLAVNYGHADVTAYSTPAADTTIGTVQVNAYGRYDAGPLYVNGIVGIGFDDYGSTRGTPVGTAQANFSGMSYTGFAEGGWRLPFAGFTVTPYASADYTLAHTPAYTESGAGAADLMVSSHDANALATTAGGKVAMPFDTGTMLGRITPEFDIGWQHQWLDTTQSLGEAFAFAPATSFSVSSTHTARNGAILGIGATAAASDRLRLYASYEARLSGTDTFQSVTAGLRYRF